MLPCTCHLIFEFRSYYSMTLFVQQFPFLTNILPAAHIFLSFLYLLYDFFQPFCTDSGSVFCLPYIVDRRRTDHQQGADDSSRAVYLCTTLDFPLCWVGKPLDCLVLNHSDNVVVILNVINNSLVLVGKIEVNRYFPVLMHPNRFYEFNHNPAVKALNVFVFQKGG